MNNKRWSVLGIVLIVLGFAGMAYQRFDFGEELPSYQQKWTFEQDALGSLILNSDYDVDVEFIDSPDGSNYVEVSGNMEQEAIDKLKAEQITGNTLQLDFKDNFDWSFFSINFQSTTQRVIVALADGSRLQQINYKSHIGNGDFSGLRAENIDLSVSDGNLRVDSILAGRLSLASTSGNITAKNIAGQAEVSVSSGNIKFDGFTGNGTFKATSGNIILTDQRSDSLDISVQSGNATLSADPQFRGFYDLQTTSGSITAPDSPQQTKDVIKVRTTSGNIRIR